MCEDDVVPLVAVDTSQGALLLDATSASEEEWGLVHRRGGRAWLQCRTCTHPLDAKEMSRSGLRFFAHAPGSPDCATKGESARHLFLKSLFAKTFRAAGWDAELEVQGNGWRADVLVSSPHGRRLAVEVQLAGISVADVEERAARHCRSGVDTLWVVEGRRPLWAIRAPNLLVNAVDDVIDSVLAAGPGSTVPSVVDASSVAQVVEWFASGRLTVPTRPIAGVGPRWPWCFQLDGCVDAHATGIMREQQEGAERDRLAQVGWFMARARFDALAAAAASAERERSARALSATAQARQSLELLLSWAAELLPWTVWFGSAKRRTSFLAVEDWRPEEGVGAYVGTDHPTHLFGIVEPGSHPHGLPLRVPAWSVRSDPPDGFAYVLGSQSVVDLRLSDLRPIVTGQKPNRLPFAVAVVHPADHVVEHPARSWKEAIYTRMTTHAVRSAVAVETVVKRVETDYPTAALGRAEDAVHQFIDDLRREGCVRVARGRVQVGGQRP